MTSYIYIYIYDVNIILDTLLKIDILAESFNKEAYESELRLAKKEFLTAVTEHCWIIV